LVGGGGGVGGWVWFGGGPVFQRKGKKGGDELGLVFSKWKIERAGGV